MVHFTDLPFEILTRILSYLLSHRDIAALSIQCRFLHAVCDMDTRRRYRRIRITPDKKSLNRAFDRLFKILKRPSLGRHVRRIEYINCTSYETERIYPPGYERDPTPEETRLLLTACHAAGFGRSDDDNLMAMLLPPPVEETEWSEKQLAYQAQAMNIVLALTALHISVSQNVEYLAIPDPCFTYSGPGTPEDIVCCPVYQLIENVHANPEERPFLQNLRTIYLLNAQGSPDPVYSQNYCFLDLPQSMVLFQGLPAIESIRTDILGAPQISILSMLDLKPAYSNFSKVSIQHSCVDSSYLATVVTFCKVLREFEYGLGGKYRYGLEYPVFNPKTFIQALLFHKATLETLDVDIDASWPFDLEEWDEEYEQEIEKIFWLLPYDIWEQSGSLKDFCSLKRLSLGIKFLMYFAEGVIAGSPRMWLGVSYSPCKEEGEDCFNLADHLPPNLEYLTIRGYKRGVNMAHDAQVDALIALKENASSKIKEITGIEHPIPNGEDFDPDVDGSILWHRVDEEWNDD
ncbi:uncharacterized protein KD926_009854 [Aspergillus affinis]|uniref:uncharacterized protein n=1 Tax=Aspergillus affinis TaxID=1070780 RepID=UPI0022FE845A|nr:uncharacterized protein KD926_009854 [Aspergillus affinis]KAI9039220.1 hypothetical protein KD926_009854 [Aspergillus affinis]